MSQMHDIIMIVSLQYIAYRKSWSFVLRIFDKTKVCDEWFIQQLIMLL